MTYKEYFAARTFSAPIPESDTWELDSYFRGIGFSDDEIAQRRKGSTSFASIVEPMPRAYHQIADGDTLTINGESWQVITGSGHSPEHACLFNPARRILLSGDQVLPGISSNVSVMSTEPAGNPLKDWLASLEKFASLPNDTLVLPAHNKPFYGLHSRLQTLAHYHEKQFDIICEACREPLTALQLMPIIFKRKLDETQSMLALGECMAHLNYMVNKQMLGKTTDEHGVYLYQVIGEDNEELVSFHE